MEQSVFLPAVRNQSFHRRPLDRQSWPARIQGSSMRFASVLLAALIFCASLVATSVLSVSAAELGTRDEAVAMVRRVQEKFKKDGPDATFKAINAKTWGERHL